MAAYRLVSDSHHLIYMLQIIEADPYWLCMLMSLSIHLYGLHFDAQYGPT